MLDLYQAVSEVLADPAATLAVCERIQQRFSGEQIYIPKHKQQTLVERDLEIWSMFDGKNERELAHCYDLSVKQIYEILRIQREAHTKRTQRDVFD